MKCILRQLHPPARPSYPLYPTRTPPSQRGRVERILSDRVVRDLPAPAEGERRTFEMAIAVRADGANVPPKDDRATQGGAVEPGVAPVGRPQTAARW